MIIGTITLLSILLLGGGGGFSFEKTFKPAVKNVVADEDKQGQVIDVTKEADEALKQLRKQVKDVWSPKLKALLDNYDATEDDFRNFVKEANEARVKIQEQVVGYRFQMKDLMTEAEWNAMYEEVRAQAEEKRKKAEK